MSGRAMICKARVARDLESLIEAAREGGLEELRRAASRANPRARQSLCLSMAAARPDGEALVAFLIPLSAPEAGESRALRCAILSGSDASIGLLAPVSDAERDGEALLCLAAFRGRGEAIEALLAWAPPSARGPAAEMAREQGHAGVASQIESAQLSDELGDLDRPRGPARGL